MFGGHRQNPIEVSSRLLRVSTDSNTILRAKRRWESSVSSGAPGIFPFADAITSPPQTQMVAALGRYRQKKSCNFLVLHFLHPYEPVLFVSYAADRHTGTCASHKAGNQYLHYRKQYNQE